MNLEVSNVNLELGNDYGNREFVLASVMCRRLHRRLVNQKRRDPRAGAKIFRPSRLEPPRRFSSSSLSLHLLDRMLNSRLLPGGRIGMDNPFRARLVQSLGRDPILVFGFFNVAFSKCIQDLFDLSLQRGLDGFVVEPSPFILTKSFGCAFGIGHGRLVPDRSITEYFNVVSNRVAAGRVSGKAAFRHLGNGPKISAWARIRIAPSDDSAAFDTGRHPGPPMQKRVTAAVPRR